MPNWCVNHLKISAEPAVINEIVNFINSSKAFTQLKNKAFHASVKLLVCGKVGMLNAVTKIEDAIYAELFNQEIYGLGENNEANLAFTNFVDLLVKKAPMSELVCNEILKLGELSKINSLSWRHIPDDKKQTVKEICLHQSLDWFHRIKIEFNIADEWDNAPSFNDYYNSNLLLDVYSLMPLPIGVALNGFNGGFFPGVMSESDWNRLYLGTKWSSFEVLIVNQSVDSLTIEFDTAWSPSTEVSQALSKRYQCYIEHVYAEQGYGYCGWQAFQNGTLMDGSTNDELLFSEEDDDGWFDVIGPAYVMALTHFGG